MFKKITIMVVAAAVLAFAAISYADSSTLPSGTNPYFDTLGNIEGAYPSAGDIAHAQEVVKPDIEKGAKIEFLSPEDAAKYIVNWPTKSSWDV